MKRCSVIVLAALAVIVAADRCDAGFAFFGTGRVIIIPKVGTYRTATFTAPPPVPLIPGTYAWRIRWPGVPFFPVPQGIPLIQDTTTYTIGSPLPTFTLMASWGFWDPDQITPELTIRVFELFTAIDDTGPVETIPLPGNLVDVSDYRFRQEDGSFRDLTVADIPTEFDFPTAAPLPPESSLDITGTSIFGLRTETEYPTTLEETTFEGLEGKLAALAPGTSYDLSHFDGLSGRVVLAYADVPTKDVIMYGEVIPEPAAMVVWSVLIITVCIGASVRKSKTAGRAAS